jgi:hypothetical protein
MLSRSAPDELEPGAFKEQQWYKPDMKTSDFVNELLKARLRR